jgi:hypothetical protein
MGVREMCEMIWAGAIGDVKEAHIWTNRPIWPQGITKPLPRKKSHHNGMEFVDRTCTLRPYNPNYAPFKWRGCGILAVVL